MSLLKGQASGGNSSLTENQIAFGSNSNTITSSDKLNYQNETLTISGSTGTSSGWGNIQQIISSEGSEAGLQFQNTGAGGGFYNLIVTSNSSGIGGNKFSIGDVYQSVSRLTIDGDGNVGINTINPSALLDVVYTTNDSRLYFKPQDRIFEMVTNDGDEKLRLDGTNEFIQISVKNGNQFYATTTEMTLMGNGGTITIPDGDLIFDNSTTGIVLRAPDGGRWRLSVSNLGFLSTTLVV